eukprot:7175152-Pyramimonas_sp.AAC.2
MVRNCSRLVVSGRCWRRWRRTCFTLRRRSFRSARNSASKRCCIAGGAVGSIVDGGVAANGGVATEPEGMESGGWFGSDVAATADNVAADNGASVT